MLSAGNEWMNEHYGCPVEKDFGQATMQVK
jgi:hypothetical protein